MSETAGVESSLFTKVGPLPAWMWAMFAVGGYFLYEHFSAGNAATTTDTTGSDTGGDTSGDTTDSTDSTDYSGSGYDDTYDPSSGDTGSYGGEYTGSSNVSPVANYATNQQWLIGAIDSLRAQGDPAGPVTTALTLYIQGKRISATDAAYVNAAIQSIGPPPQPLPIQQTTGTPTTPTATNAAVPVAPQISAGRVTRTSITIKWPAVPHAVNYQVVAGSKVHMQAGRTYTLTGLKSKTEHKFYVRGRNNKGQLGPESNHLSVTTK